MKKILNKKGYMLYELLISFALASIVIINMFSIVVSLNKKMSQVYANNEIYKFKSLVYKKIAPDFYKYNIKNIVWNSSNQNLEITYDINTGETKKLVVSSGEKYISYNGDKTVANDLEIKLDKPKVKIITDNDTKILKLTIPLSYNNEQHNIEIYSVNDINEEITDINV